MTNGRRRNCRRFRRLDLAEVVLTIKISGVKDLRNFRWLEKTG